MTLALLVTFGAFGITVAVTSPPSRSQPSGVVQLTADRTEHIDPTFSPDGKYIAFSSNSSGSYDVWVMREDGRKLTRLTWLPGDEVAPEWSPDESNLTYLWNHGQYSDVCMTPMGTGSSICLTDRAHVRSYSWSPDGLLIAYDAGNGTIRLRNMSTGHEASFPFDANVSYPAFSPDSATLYFSVKTERGNYIWEASVNGSNSKKLSWMGSDVRPQASPSGNYLMYLTNLSGRYEPWLVDLDTGVNTYLFTRPELGLSYTFPTPPLLAAGTVPRWGPNGTNVLMISNGNGTRGDLYLVTLNIPVDIATEGPHPFNGLPAGTFFPLNIYNQVPLGQPVVDAQWGPSGNIVVTSSVSGFEQLILFGRGPQVNVGYGG